MPSPHPDLENVRVVNLTNCPLEDGATQLLNFFESAPLLQAVELQGTIPHPSNAPPERTVALPHLNILDLRSSTPHSIFLNNLDIPTGTSLIFFPGCHDMSSSHLDLFLDYRPEMSSNLRNLPHITTINFLF